MSTGTPHFDFSDSVVLVTGGGSGIGLAITRAFLAAGATVAVAGRRREPLDEALRGAPADRAVAVPTDLADKEQIGGLVDEVVRRFGRLDVVVSNAAGYSNGEITELDDADWEAMRATNVDGFFHLAKKALPVLAESGGNLVAVSSVSGLAGDWGQAGYNATKAAVSNFVRSG
jgi:meso-butanediol dehydrogenase / (S,S)-butanediol dehydrogenase / diacetyl reductase